METFINALTILSYITVILGIPSGLYQLIKASRKEQREREEAVYHALDEKYLDFQRLCLQYPYLDVFDVPDKWPGNLTTHQKKEELILFTMLFSLFERAYILHNKENQRVLKGQWAGWQAYIHAYCQRENFQAAWKISGETFDPRFQVFMDKAIKSLVLPVPQDEISSKVPSIVQENVKETIGSQLLGNTLEKGN